MKLPIPPKSIYSPSFKYVPASKTDIRETFERVRKEQAAKPTNVKTFKTK
jgi:hypothetical protein